MNTPMYLPWLARKAGISDERAQELWREALCHATDTSGWVGGPEYWAAANARLLELTDIERRQMSPRLVRMARHQKRLLQLPLQAIEDLLGAWRAGNNRRAA
ncbi:hypothetical protein OPU71_06815 [Niveibacterium sp. 24ML]|uniref:hypothetical protein n=1 Tax=Niveibacterium sp. 24ML TaxID=2985512 RepID=UPI00226DE0CB|nr:hypothetical protein [Niveibacterium sp. 24ML]MCX9155838.1 hypothetical protein [Niveibacterium sp. 24ML]